MKTRIHSSRAAATAGCFEAFHRLARDAQHEALDRLVPENPNQPYDMHQLIQSVADGGYFLEVQAQHAPNIIVGFTRLGGKPVGVVANQPAHLAGVLDIQRIDSITGFFKGSPFNLSIILALLSCAVMYFIIRITKLGYEIKTTGLNINAAYYAKIKVKRILIISMAVSGGFAGLAGINFVNGYKHYFELGFSEGAGYIGIAVALMAKNNPWGIVIVAIFFGILEYGGVTINTMLPKEIITILQAFIIIFVVITSKVMDRKLLKE